jgi:hypothetical protein
MMASDADLADCKFRQSFPKASRLEMQTYPVVLPRLFTDLLTI